MIASKGEWKFLTYPRNSDFIEFRISKAGRTELSLENRFVMPTTC